MAEQTYLWEICFPAEGRCDIAIDLEEEQRNAYSTHRVGISLYEKKVVSKTRQQDQDQWPETGLLPPVEGRCDIAVDLEEEQRNAYSSRHAKQRDETPGQPCQGGQVQQH